MTVPFTELALFDQYMEKMQALVIEQGFSNSSEIQKLIEDCLAVELEGEGVRQFFLGEQAFFQSEFKKALAHYSQAKAVPHFRFFVIVPSPFFFAI